jgi:hypothetical protein
MRRMVIGLVLAAAMLMPAVGMAAAPKKQPPPVVWWHVIVEWVNQTVGLEKSQTTTPTQPPSSQGTAPNTYIDAGSTVDPYSGS